MDRLTKVYENGRVTIDGARFGVDQAVLDSEVASNKAIVATVKRLAELEDAEEAGLLVRLPCKVGDTVYKLCTVNSRIAIGSMWDGRIVKNNCDRCGYRGCGCIDIGLRENKCGTMINIITPIEVKSINHSIRLMPYMNKHYFLTPEAAEQALKARTNNG